MNKKVRLGFDSLDKVMTIRDALLASSEEKQKQWHTLASNSRIMESNTERIRKMAELSAEIKTLQRLAMVAMFYADEIKEEIVKSFPIEEWFDEVVPWIEERQDKSNSGEK